MKEFVLLFVLVAPTGQYKEAMLYQKTFEECTATLEKQRDELVSSLPEGYKYILECVPLKVPMSKL